MHITMQGRSEVRSLYGRAACIPILLLLGSPRRRTADEPPLKSPEEALSLVAEISDLTSKVRRFPGLEEGKVEEIERGEDRILREYSNMNPRRPNRFLRDLSDLATVIDTARQDGLISEKQRRILELMIKKTKMRDFYVARKLLMKFSKPLELKKERDAKYDRYSSYHKKMEMRAKELKSEIAKMRSVPLAEKSPEEIAAARKTLDEYNEAAASALVDFFAHSPCIEAISFALEASAVAELNIPAPRSRDSVKQLIRVLQEEHVRAVFCEENIGKLVEAAGFTEKRMEHFVRDFKWFQRQLHENTGWLAELTAARSDALRISWTEDASDIKSRISVIRPYLKRLPQADRAIGALDKLASLLESGDYDVCLRSEAVYKTEGDIAVARFRGTLDDRIEKFRAEMEEILALLGRLPDPEKLISSGHA